MTKNSQKGFTIIELLVVIAIIAVLAAIVLVNVTQYINKGKDAAIKGNLATAMTDAAVWFDSSNQGNGTYNNLNYCTNAASPWVLSISPAIQAAQGAAPTCNATATQWCSCSQLKTDTTKSYCVDSSGVKKESAGANTCDTDTCTALAPQCS